MKQKQTSLFEGHRLNLQDALDLSVDSLREYGKRYAHTWCSAAARQLALRRMNRPWCVTLVRI